MRLALLSLLLAAVPALAQPAGHQTELSLAFTYEAVGNERPLVVIGGEPTNAFAYSGDSNAHAVDVAATRFLCPVPDDGTSPLALLPYLARESSLGARFALSAGSRDSWGSATGVGQSLVSTWASDRSQRTASLSAEWFFHDSTALRAGFETQSMRETAATSTIESPSGRGDLSSYGTRSSRFTATLGVSRRFGAHALTLEGFFTPVDTARTDRTVFTGASTPYQQELGLTGDIRGLSLSARLLLAGRRLAVDGAGTYAESRSDLDITAPQARSLDSARTIDRRLSGAATWFASRRLGFTLGAGYGSRSSISGTVVMRPSQWTKTVTLSAVIRYFATARAAVEVVASRSEATNLNPPDDPTFEKIVDTTTRVALLATLRL